MKTREEEYIKNEKRAKQIEQALSDMQLEQGNDQKEIKRLTDLVAVGEVEIKKSKEAQQKA